MNAGLAKSKDSQEMGGMKERKKERKKEKKKKDRNHC